MTCARFFAVRLALISILVGCSTPSASVAPATPSHHVAAEAPKRLDPVIEIPPADSSCNLAWDEVSEPTLAMLAPGSAVPDECPPDFGPTGEGCDGFTVTTDIDGECKRGQMRGGQHADLITLGPNGSGRYVTVGLTLGNRFMCTMASTVGWRNLYPVGNMLAPLPWLSDVDGDGDAELILWERLPWGDAEIENALLPVVYVLDGDRLVRRDDKAHALRARVGAAYAKLATMGNQDAQSHACFVALANMLH